MFRFLSGMIFAFLIVMVSQGQDYIYSNHEVAVVDGPGEREIAPFMPLVQNSDDHYSNERAWSTQDVMVIKSRAVMSLDDSALIYEKSCKIDVGVGSFSPVNRSEHSRDLLEEEYLALSASAAMAPTYDYLMEASVYCL